MLDILIRLHDTADISLFKEAISSIQSQSYKKYNITILGQSLSLKKRELLSLILKETNSYKIHNLELPAGDFRAYLLNYGFNACTSDYLAILDYDDLVYVKSYELLIDDIEKNNADISFGGVRKVVFDPDQHKILSFNEQAFWGPGTYYHFLNRPFFPIHSYVINLKKIKESSLKLPQFPEELSYLEDSCFLAQLLPIVKSSFTYYNQMLFDYRFRIDSDSFTLTQSKKTRKKWNESRAYFYALAKKMKVQHEDIIFYENKNIVSRLKSVCIGFLNRKPFFKHIRDLITIIRLKFWH